MSGMGAGSWLAGVIYDYYGFYAPAFATGLAFNIANFTIIAGLVVVSTRFPIAFRGQPQGGVFAGEPRHLRAP